MAFSALGWWLGGGGDLWCRPYGVTQRIREFGIRVALGATGSEITRLAAWQAHVGARRCGVGLVLAVGAAGAMVISVFGHRAARRDQHRQRDALLPFGHRARELHPARPAGAVDPAITLRAE